MGRRKKNYTLTQEQINFRKSILRGRVSSIKKAEVKPEAQVLTHEEEIQTCFYYINNCVFWINEYIDGNPSETKERLLKTAQSLQMMGKRLEKLLTKP